MELRQPSDGYGDIKEKRFKMIPHNSCLLAWVKERLCSVFSVALFTESIFVWGFFFDIKVEMLQF